MNRPTEFPVRPELRRKGYIRRAERSRRALTRLVMNADRRLQDGRTDDDKEARGVVGDILLSPS